MTTRILVPRFRRTARGWHRALPMLGCLLALVLLSSATAEAQTSFVDVPPGFWAASCIATVTQRGIMEGCGGDFFCPTDPVTREDMAVWLERAKHWDQYPDPGYTPPPCTQQDFGDVPCSYCLAPWIEQLYHDGITTGCGDGSGNYCSYRPLTRAQMAVFLLRTEHGSGYSPPDWCAEHQPTFGDVPCSFWAIDWIEALYAEGVTAGCNPPENTDYCPFDQVTRAQMATFLTRLYDDPSCGE